MGKLHATTRSKLLPLTALAALTACSADNTEPPSADNTPAADLILVNADVYTSDQTQPSATAFAVRDGRFIAVGDNAVIRRLQSERTAVIDAAGATILPGLVDGHTHIVGGSVLATGVDLTEIEDKDEWLRIIAAKAESLPEGSWILGGRWDHNLSDGILPNKAMLDRVAPRHPVLLDDIDGHTYWANSLAIELAGITVDTPAPPGAVIVTDAATGELSGIFKEADPLFAGAPGMREATDPETGLRAAVRLANSLGITSVHDMSGHYDAFLSVLEAGDLTLRVWQGHIGARDAALDPAQFFADAAEERARIAARVAASGLNDMQGPLFELGYVKLIIDGVLSTHTALMKEPYSDKPEAIAEPIVTKEQLSAMVKAAHDNDFPVAVHAIGDRAVSWVLDAFAAAPREEGTLPDRIEHIEVVTPDDIERFRALGIVASMQPHHATCCVGNYVIERIGRERLPNAYAWRSMVDAGVPLVLGSDWATSPFNPLIQLADTLHRETRIDGVTRPWDEGQTLTFEEALRGYTQAGATVTAWDEDIGSIEAGKWADFVILDQTLPHPVDATINQRQVAATYLAGERVYPE